MDIARFKFDKTVLIAVQVLKLQLELNDGHSVRATRSVEELVTLLELSTHSSSDPVRNALIQLISLLSKKQIVCFEALGVNFSPIKQWATEKKKTRHRQPGTSHKLFQR